MKFRKIKLVNFKCYGTANVDLHPNINCIIGSNGAGKTNLMDALYYICFTKSYFTSSDQFVTKKEASFFRMESEIEANEKVLPIIITLSENGKKTLVFNHVEVNKRTDYIGEFPAVMIAPDDNQIILGGSEVRRRFMSGCIAQYNSDYLKVLLPYKKILRQRNAALKQFLKNGRADYTLLDAIDQQLIHHGDLLFKYRKEFIEAFQPVFDEMHQQLVKNAENVSIGYVSRLEESGMQAGLASSRNRDLASGRSNFGPHKDDLEFTIHQQPLKSIGSQGQQKSFLVALKLAQYEIIKQKTNKKPFLFLDDLFDKFDENRILKLIGLIKSDGFGQIFITDTHKDRIKSLLDQYQLEHKIIEVEKGIIIND